ncbi:4-hydroxy-tetrahydrodipicolinate synthase [Paenibacillus flagellatus]|uniref:4-hydroxy-tetrahydrodipicolinate synthase n=1 Tax=Paenibacillus flagellatus TaxID=2211139 RepID=A0A2V5KCH5_9BACL|nr:4-hydroxy-tetrahydrodipicolinate synthase [Paenibacillus flagellatus]PYI57301.1 4-hydroxy-tetrahydrodipicolinate synthase [Paenibacillus flagellatus]
MLAERLKGVFVPVVAPFTPDRKLDAESFRNVVHAVLEQRVHGIVVNGTTGESPAVRWEEVRRMTEIALEVRGERSVPVIVGTGSNDTRTAVMLTKRARQLGADGALVVTPYYNRPSAAGVLEHYKRVGDAGLPIVAYHIPYRTGLELTPDDIAAVLELEAVAGIKESSGGIRHFIELGGRTEKALLCGDDLYFFAALCCGAAGGMLASAHVRTHRFVKTYESFAKGRWTEAKAAFDELVPLIRLLFAEPNPAPVKTALQLGGLIRSDAVRLPMTRTGEALRGKLEALLNGSKL